jgi:hypothetical protein
MYGSGMTVHFHHETSSDSISKYTSTQCFQFHTPPQQFISKPLANMTVLSPCMPEELGALLPPDFMDLRNKTDRVHNFFLKQYDALRNDEKSNC